MMQNGGAAKNDGENRLKFLIPSVIGVILFLIPIQYQGESMIVVGIFVNYSQDVLKHVLPYLMTAMIAVPTAITLWNALFTIRFIQDSPTWHRIFTTTRFWLAVRLAGAFLAVLTLFGCGPQMICSPDTGGNILFSLLPTCGMWFFVAGLFLPLLTDYGIMDLVSTILKDIARPLFHVPGRSLIDCFSSWIGSGVCGAYLTISQYETGCYTAREAAIIVTNFSVVSISFCSAIAQYLKISQVFGLYYLTIFITGFLCALITPRIWPLNRMADHYNPECGRQASESVPENVSKLQWGYRLALQRAAVAPSFKGFITKGLTTAFDLIANTAPILMAFGTAALILTQYTRLFDIMSYPFKILLQLFSVPYAAEAAPAMILGFADQYLPVIVGASIPSFYTRFIIGCVAVLQVIYITEIGAMILTSRLPLKLWHLFVIFLERTLISLPMVVLFANLFSIH